MVISNHFAHVRKMVYHFRDLAKMMLTIFVNPRKWSARRRFAAALLFCALSAPVVHRNAERLTGAFLCETGAYEKRPFSRCE